MPEPFLKSDYIELYKSLIPFKEYFEDKGYTFPCTDALIPQEGEKPPIMTYVKVILRMGAELSVNLGIASDDEYHLNVLSGIFDEYYYKRCLNG